MCVVEVFRSLLFIFSFTDSVFDTREHLFPLVFMIPWFGFAHLFEECDSCDSKKTQLARVRARVVSATIRSNLFVG